MMSDGSPPRRLRRDAIIERFAPTLGLEKSEEIVLAAMRKLGLSREGELSLDQVLAVVDDLATTSGLVGVVARFVKARGDLNAIAGANPSPPSPLGSRGAPQAPQNTALPVGRVEEPQLAASELIEYFATAMGDARAKEVVTTHAASIGAAGRWLSRGQVMALLEAMAEKEGIVGVTARFAKAKFILQLRS